MLSSRTLLCLHAKIILQREFWLQAILLPKRAGLTLYLLVGLQHFQMFLSPMEPCLHAPLQMALLLQAQFLHSDHHHHLKVQHSHLCRWLDSHLGRFSHSNQVRQSHHLWCIKSSSSGQLPRICHHPLHRQVKLLQGLSHHQWEWEANHLCGVHHHLHPYSSSLVGP